MDDAAMIALQYACVNDITALKQYLPTLFDGITGGGAFLVESSPDVRETRKARAAPLTFASCGFLGQTPRRQTQQPVARVVARVGRKSSRCCV